MKTQTFPSLKVGDFYDNNFVCVRYDMEKEQGKTIAAKFKGQITRYPTHLFVNSAKGNEIFHKALGMMNPDEFIAEGKLALSGTGLKYLQKRFDEGDRNFEFFKKYANAYFKSGKRDEACNIVSKYYEKYHTSDSLLNESNYVFYTSFINTDISTKLLWDIIILRSKFSRLKFPNTQFLDKDILRVLGIATSDLVKIGVDDNGVRALKTDSVKYKRIVSLCNRIDNIDQCALKDIQAKILIYDKLRNGDYESAAYSIKFAHELNLKSLNIFYITDNYVYMAQKNPKKEFVYKLIADLEQIQAERSRSFTTFNIYPTISKLYTIAKNKKMAEQCNKKNMEIAKKKQLKEQQQEQQRKKEKR